MSRNVQSANTPSRSDSASGSDPWPMLAIPQRFNPPPLGASLGAGPAWFHQPVTLSRLPRAKFDTGETAWTVFGETLNKISVLTAQLIGDLGEADSVDALIARTAARLGVARSGGIERVVVQALRTLGDQHLLVRADR